MHFQASPKSQEYRQRVRAFIRTEVLPHEANLRAEREGFDADWREWKKSSLIESLKLKAREQGLWNLFLPDADLAAGLSTLEYAPIAEEMGKSIFAPEIFNCNAPDTGNMEVLYHYGNEAQKAQWLRPLLSGEIRSVFCMTEPDVASSDATNMEATITLEGDEVVLNGKKWWTTGLGHPDAKVAIFMGKSNPENPRHQQHTMVLVPLKAEGVRIKRMLPVYGGFDAPYGHGEVWFDHVRLPKENVIQGLGAGFAIAQGRLGPGRIHHCMRAVGAAERALQLLIERGLARTAFGKPLIELGANREKVADLRLMIDQARLLTLYAAWKIDTEGVMNAMTEISAIKVAAPQMLQAVVDEAIQLYGGAGLSGDTPLADFFAMARALRLADGPDAVHRSTIARLELGKYAKRG